MKKTTMIVKGKKDYEIRILINNTALINGINATGLLNVNSNMVIGEMRPYHTTYDENKKFYIQTYDDMVATSEANNLVKKNVIRIYDAEKEVMLVDGAELKGWLGEYKDTIAFRYADGTYHLFDYYLFRSVPSILETSYESIDFFFKRYNDNYLIIREHGKFGIYKIGKGVIVPPQYDSIKKSNNIMVFKSGNKYYFAFDSNPEVFSATFESITQDEDNSNIIYCRTSDMLYIYNTYTEELLLKTSNMDTKYFKKSENSHDDYNEEFYFETTSRGRKGLIRCEREKRKNGTNTRTIIPVKLLPCEYDEIKSNNHYNFFYIRKGNKWGLIYGTESENFKIVSPNYEDIDYLGDGFFALYNNGVASIVLISTYNGIKNYVDNVKDIVVKRRAIIYENVNGKKGIINTDSDVKERLFDDNYDDVEPFGEYYFLVTKNGLKGVIHLGEFIIPMEYEDIKYKFHKKDGGTYGGIDMVFFSLKKNGRYQFAKRGDYNYRSSNTDSPVEYANNRTYMSIEFLSDIIILRDDIDTYIYDYSDRFHKRLPLAAKIMEVNLGGEYSFDKKVYYDIDGVYYFFKKDKFEEVHVEEQDCYITTYEVEGDTFEARTFNKKEHDIFCTKLEELSDEDAHKTLNEFASNPYRCHNSYPTLTLKRLEENDKK